MGLIVWAAVGLLPAEIWAVTIHSVSQSATEVGLYRPLTVQFSISRSYANPYDPDQVDARFEFTGPSGVTRTIPAFYAAEGPGWMARIVPVEPGPHAATIRVSDHTGESAAYDLTFQAVESGERGFVRVDTRNPRYLRYDNGDPYRPVGQNLCWHGDNPNFMTWLDRMAGAGENWTRYWLVAFVGQDVEWGGGAGDAALGRYSQNNSRLIDRMVEAVRTRGIQVQMCLDSFNGWNRYLHDNWDINPYNSANGGMLNRPIDFFTNADAKRYAKRRFRYIVARWGYCPNILCWELWNEVDAVGTGDIYFGDFIPQVVAWHREMAQYIRSIDPYDHLITTSFADDGPPSWYQPFWQAPEMDIVQLHRYSIVMPDDHVKDIRAARVYNKPVIMGEGNRAGQLGNIDRDGGSLHLLNWIGAVEESGIMSWWWDSWIDPNNLYYRFPPVKQFLQGEDWAGQNLGTRKVTLLTGHDVKVYGASGPRHAYLFAQAFSAPISGLRLRLDEHVAGTYRVEYWDTGAGTISSTNVVSNATTGLVLDVPVFSWNVAIKVKPNLPVILLSADTLAASATLGATPSSASFELRNDGGGEMSYAIGSDVNWLAITPISGSSAGETDTIHIQWQTGHLSPGVYHGTITVHAPAAENTPRTVAVTLTIERHPADLDGDGDVDQEDFGILQACFSGTGIPQQDPACTAARLDDDQDVDVVDLALLRGCMGPPEQRPEPDCLGS